MAQADINWINQTYDGGISAYTASQQNRINQALQSGDQETVQKLLADSQRVGYSLNLVPKPSSTAGQSPADALKNGAFPMTGGALPPEVLDWQKANGLDWQNNTKQAAEKVVDKAKEAVDKVFNFDFTFGPGVKTAFVAIVALMLGSTVLSFFKR